MYILLLKVKTDTENMKIQKTETDTEKIEKELFYGLENKEWKRICKKI